MQVRIFILFSHLSAHPISIFPFMITTFHSPVSHLVVLPFIILLINNFTVRVKFLKRASFTQMW